MRNLNWCCWSFNFYMFMLRMKRGIQTFSKYSKHTSFRSTPGHHSKYNIILIFSSKQGVIKHSLQYSACLNMNFYLLLRSIIFLLLWRFACNSTEEGNHNMPVGGHSMLSLSEQLGLLFTVFSQVLNLNNTAISSVYLRRYLICAQILTFTCSMPCNPC